MKDIGQKLKDARERKGFSVNEVSIAIKINTKTLQAIEQGDVNQLPAKPFLRGFVQTYSKYLDLNVDEVMKTFAEEIGTTRPQIQNDPAAQTDSVANTEEAHKQFDTFKKFGFIAAAFVAIGLVYFIQQTVGKYEKEQQVAETQKSVLIGNQDQTQPASEAPSATTESATTNLATQPAPAPETTTQNTAAPSTVPTQAPTVAATNALATNPTPAPTVAAPAPTPATAAPTTTVAKVVTPPSTTAPATPLVLKPTTPTPVAPTTPATTAPVTTKPPVEAAKPVVKTETTQPAQATTPPVETLKKSPQNIVIEALDNVEIRYQRDGQPEKTVRLKPEQILTLSADYKVNISINDGGAVSVIRNGREVGVPGSLGKPAKLNYP